MKSKSIVISAILGLTIGGMVFASHYLHNETPARTLVQAEEPIADHTVTIDYIPFTSLYGEWYKAMQSNDLVFPLNTPGLYGSFTLQAFGSKKFNTDGHLFVATMEEPVGMHNWFSIGVQALREGQGLYQTEADYPANPLNIVGFRDLRGVDIYMGEASVVYPKKRTDYPYSEFGYSYDPIHRVYSFTGDITGRVDPMRFEFTSPSSSDGKPYTAGELLIVDKIVLHYNC